MACEFPIVVKTKLVLTAIHCLLYFTYFTLLVTAAAKCMSMPQSANKTWVGLSPRDRTNRPLLFRDRISNCTICSGRNRTKPNNTRRSALVADRHGGRGGESLASTAIINATTVIWCRRIPCHKYGCFNDFPKFDYRNVLSFSFSIYRNRISFLILRCATVLTYTDSLHWRIGEYGLRRYGVW